jgi:hypothetical protein
MVDRYNFGIEELVSISLFVNRDHSGCEEIVSILLFVNRGDHTGIEELV